MFFSLVVLSASWKYWKRLSAMFKRNNLNIQNCFGGFFRWIYVQLLALKKNINNWKIWRIDVLQPFCSKLFIRYCKWEKNGRTGIWTWVAPKWAYHCNFSYQHSSIVLSLKIVIWSQNKKLLYKRIDTGNKG